MPQVEQELRDALDKFMDMERTNSSSEIRYALAELRDALRDAILHSGHTPYCAGERGACACGWSQRYERAARLGVVAVDERDN